MIRIISLFSFFFLNTINNDKSTTEFYICNVILYVNKAIYIYTLQKKKRIRCFRYFNTCTLNQNFSFTLIDIVKLTVYSSMISI